MVSNTERTYFVSAPRHLEDLLQAELAAMGCRSVKPGRGGVYFSGPPESAYRVCLRSRIAARVLLPLATFDIESEADLYRRLASFSWDEHMDADTTFLIDAILIQAPLTHTRYASQRVKDAVADYFRRRSGRRPSVDTRSPDLRFNLYVHRRTAVLSLDLSGGSLHRRGYRTVPVEAGLKENLAAAVLMRAGWPDIAREGGPLVDLMCGSGTFLIEAAMMAADIAPGLLRDRFGFERWKQHDGVTWRRLLEDARRHRTEGLRDIPRIIGFDADPNAVKAARSNIRSAGLERFVSCETKSLSQWRRPYGIESGSSGLVVVNPPYGERIHSDTGLHRLYRELGRVLSECFPGWRAAVLAGSRELSREIGLKAFKCNALNNGPLDVCLAHFNLTPENRYRWSGLTGAGTSSESPAPYVSGEAEMFRRRLRKRLRHLKRWAARNDIRCYRIYDADIPQFNVAIDVYQDRWAHVQEYAPPATIDPSKARRRLNDILASLPGILDIPETNVFLKRRIKRKRGFQYEKLGDARRFHIVTEGGLRFQVNFEDYLDTGLFLDHRRIRALIRKMSRGVSFLNLFCYTATATVYAAAGGARKTVSVDASRTYLDWARRNFNLNDIRNSGKHVLVRADVRQWLSSHPDRFGLIFLDPPTFSNTHGNRPEFDVQRDHRELIELCMHHLEPDGTLIFSTNFRKFKLDDRISQRYRVKDITRSTLPEDFRRRPEIHKAWIIRNRPGSAL